MEPLLRIVSRKDVNILRKEELRNLRNLRKDVNILRKEEKLKEDLNK